MPTDDPPPYMNPMTTGEVTDMLKATMHGPLPRATQQRIFATLAAWEPIVRRVQLELAEVSRIVELAGLDDLIERDEGSD